MDTGIPKMMTRDPGVAEMTDDELARALLMTIGPKRLGVDIERPEDWMAIDVVEDALPALFRAVDELGELRDILRSYGFVPCDIPACNCGRWHPRYGLKERWDEICDLLDAAGHPLSNENGHIALRALQSFVDERDELRKRVAELESHKTRVREWPR